MFNQILNSIVENHPLLGLEEKDQNKGHLSGLKAPDWVNRGAIYEIFIRNFSAEGSWARGMNEDLEWPKTAELAAYDGALTGHDLLGSQTKQSDVLRMVDGIKIDLWLGGDRSDSRQFNIPTKEE